MAYRSLEEALFDLERAGMLKRIRVEVDPDLEMAAIAREAYATDVGAVLFEKVKGSPFRAATNIFGSEKQLHYLFRNTIPAIKLAIQAKANPAQILKRPWLWPKLPGIGLHALPLKSATASVCQYSCSLSDLPQIRSWPKDGGAFLTLPQVCSAPLGSKNIMRTNLGMYRIQISGNDYTTNEECGLHYQINRDIAKHHEEAITLGKPLKISIFLGGSPAHALAAAMPMPASISETVFAGILAGRAFRYQIHEGWFVSSEADFCILGEIQPDLKPEGPFGDHLGYYSGKHPFPYMKVKKVFHKKNAIYPFTVVSRPPAEDSSFGAFIHELVDPMVPVSVTGLHEMNAVDAAGVHPLLLALGSERFIPYAPREPMELHKIANALLGFNQASLAKYLWIAAKEDNVLLSAHDVPHFITHVLERLHFERDLHFETATTIDTLDYSGGTLNHGSKVILSAAGSPCRSLGQDFQKDFEGFSLPDGFSNPQLVAPGILSISASPNAPMQALAAAFSDFPNRESYPWVTVTENSAFAAAFFDNWLWITFTRSDPAKDIYGVNARIKNKHWQCEAPLLIDARLKPGYQQPLSVPEAIRQRAIQILQTS